jgi:glycosyltransferase involved in cell wall biosynthesis
VYFKDIKFDLILYSTPPIQYNRIIKYLKSKSKASTYLLLKDIFPQNAIDMGLLKKWNPIYWYFKKKEKETYRLSDTIGCMSPANVSYLLTHNPYLQPVNIEVCANTIRARGVTEKELRNNFRAQVRQSLSINESELLLIYGGNLGISKGIPFLTEILKAYHQEPNIKFLVVGEGTWYVKIARFLSEGDYKNVILQKRVSPGEFRKMLFAADIGLIFLNPKFTIPNFPSWLTSYLEVGLPVIACTDPVTDMGDIIQRAGCGYKVLSGDIQGFNAAIKKLTATPGILPEKSANARSLFEKEYTTAKAYSVLMKHYRE